MAPKPVLAERIECRDIPCLRVRPRFYDVCDEPLPTVVFYHRWHSSKDDELLIATTVAAYGYQVVVPDALHHGERDPVDHDDPAVLDRLFWKVIVRTVAESGRLLVDIVKDHHADPARLAVAGTSMGGFSAAGVLTANAGVNCATVLNGSCAWVRAEELFRQREGKPTPTREELPGVWRYDPLRNRLAIKRRPILMLHDSSDSVVPVDSQRMFATELRPLYHDVPERLQLTEFSGIDHHVTVDMLEAAVDWFGRWLR